MAIVVADGDSVVASLRDRYGASVEHDARLIAAAPDLLEALTRIANVDDMPMLASEVIALAKAAIAKATS